MSKKINEFKSFEAAKYENIDLDRLVVYAMVLLAGDNIDLSLENIIVGTT